MATTTSLKQYLDEAQLLGAIEAQGLTEEIVAQNDWSKEMSAKELLEELKIGSDV